MDKWRVDAQWYGVDYEKNGNKWLVPIEAEKEGINEETEFVKLEDVKALQEENKKLRELKKYSTIVHKEECEFWNSARVLPNCTCGLRELLKGE